MVNGSGRATASDIPRRLPTIAIVHCAGRPDSPARGEAGAGPASPTPGAVCQLVVQAMAPLSTNWLGGGDPAGAVTPNPKLAVPPGLMVAR